MTLLPSVSRELGSNSRVTLAHATPEAQPLTLGSPVLATASPASLSGPLLRDLTDPARSPSPQLPVWATVSTPSNLRNQNLAREWQEKRDGNENT